MSSATVRLIGGPKDGELMTVLFGDSIVIYEPAIVGMHQILQSDPVIEHIRKGEYLIAEDRMSAVWRPMA